jgi:hypothetical protein
MNHTPFPGKTPRATGAQNRKLFARFPQNLANPITWNPQKQRFPAGFSVFHGRLCDRIIQITPLCRDNKLTLRFDVTNFFLPPRFDDGYLVPIFEQRWHRVGEWHFDFR